MMFVCPVCRGRLQKADGAFKCKKGHSFDISRRGYVNLLLRTSSGVHGDDKIMLRARRDFLEKGYYGCLRSALAGCIRSYCPNPESILDAGCGEGWYTCGIAREFPQAVVCGFDISKDALALAGRHAGIQFAAASSFDIPMPDESFDVVYNVFSPIAPAEFSRVLKKDGILVCALPDRRHLWQLKQAVYDTPYENPPPSEKLELFEHLESIPVKHLLRLNENEDIQNLFKMTPYYYKTSETDRKKLEKVEKLEVQLEFVLTVYRKD